MDSQVSNQETTSEVERFHETSEYDDRWVYTTALTHLNKRSFSTNAIKYLCQGLVVLANILVLKKVDMLSLRVVS